MRKDRRFVWKAKDFFLIVEVYFCWLGRVDRVVLLSIFCFVSLRESLTMPEVEFTASRCRRVLDTEIQLCKFFLQKEDKDLTSGRIEYAQGERRVVT